MLSSYFAPLDSFDFEIYIYFLKFIIEEKLYSTILDIKIEKNTVKFMSLYCFH